MSTGTARPTAPGCPTGPTPTGSRPPTAWAASSIGRPASGSTRPPPVATLASAARLHPPTFSPNGDGAADAWTGTLNVNEGVIVDAAILGSDGTVVRHLSATSVAGTVKMTWDGRSDGGGGVADGQYVVTLSCARRGRQRRATVRP